MIGSARRAAVAAILALASAVALAQGRGGEIPDEYLQLVARYRGGDDDAALALAAAARGHAPRVSCRGRGECQAAGVLNLDAAATLFGGGREDGAQALLDATRPLLARQEPGFAFEWLLAAAALRQAYGNHARAFTSYEQALASKPTDPRALLGEATALEFSAIPDGFGGVGVSGRDVWRVLLLSGEPPRELSALLANPRIDAPYRRLLLEHLTRLYRQVLEVDSSQAEARLRLGRVLEERGRRPEAEVEIRAIATSSGDPFLVAIARLCLARFEASPEREAAAFRWALDVDPSPGPAWLGLARALLASSDRAGALAAVENALSPEENRRNTAWVDYHLGRGRMFPAALERLRDVVRAEPGR